jgi:hypothetical protein
LVKTANVSFHTGSDESVRLSEETFVTAENVRITDLKGFASLFWLKVAAKRCRQRRAPSTSLLRL